MVPPAFLEVIQNIPKRKFNGLETNGSEHQHFEITDYESLGEPTKEVPKGEDI
jgi:hypothetical protein